MRSEPSGLGEVCAAASDAHGLDLTRFDIAFLSNVLEQRRTALGCTSLGAYAERLTASATEAFALRSSLRVSYSEFFRDPLTFAALEQTVLPGLVERRSTVGKGELRIWSAGCASGEEAWSMAMLLDAANVGGMSYRVFGTDVSVDGLETARTAVYDPKSLRNVPLRHLDSCFDRTGERFRVKERLRPRVEFSEYDLLDPATTSPPSSIFGEFDLVVCSNVLLYHSPAARQAILAKLRRSLTDRGTLITGDTERQIVLANGSFLVSGVATAIFTSIRSET